MNGFFIIDFKIPGKPVALKRHRTVRIGDFNKNYDPSEGDKKDFLVLAMGNKPNIPLDEPLYVKLTFCFPRPKAHFRTGKNSHLLKDSAPKWHTGTPDCDNLIKFVCDSLNGIFWKDDKCICSVSAEKIYEIDGITPHIHVQVKKIYPQSRA
jgi:Holliday junction resolvase RusA-like endonuclease